jgi:hypothetical protein
MNRESYPDHSPVAIPSFLWYSFFEAFKEKTGQKAAEDMNGNCFL